MERQQRERDEEALGPETINTDMRGSSAAPSVPRAVSWLPGQILASPLERDEEETSSERRRGQTWALLSPTVCFLCAGDDDLRRAGR